MSPLETVAARLRIEQAVLDELVPTLTAADRILGLTLQARLQYALDSLDDLHPGEPELPIAGDDLIKRIL